MAMDGNVIITRYLLFIIFFGAYGVVAFGYGLKIIGMLASGKKGMSSQAKTIVKVSERNERALWNPTLM
jgi:hypothetical protein|tara:strand:+ start:183 stop:389 length:207 start_codon:yes stop_codon:yes gene_type:complete